MKLKVLVYWVAYACQVISHELRREKERKVSEPVIDSQ